MADNEKELRIKVTSVNPEVLPRIKTQVKEIVNIGEKGINLAVNSSNLQTELIKLEQKFKELQSLTTLNIKLEGNAEQQIRAIQLELSKTFEKEFKAQGITNAGGLSASALDSAITQAKNMQKEAAMAKAKAEQDAAIAAKEALAAQKTADKELANLHKQQVAAAQAIVKAKQQEQEEIQRAVQRLQNQQAAERREEARGREAAIFQYQQAIAPKSYIDQPARDKQAAIDTFLSQQNIKEADRQFNQEFRGERLLGRLGNKLGGPFRNNLEQEALERASFSRGILPEELGKSELPLLNTAGLLSKEGLKRTFLATAFSGAGGGIGSAAGEVVGGPLGSIVGQIVGKEVFDQIGKVFDGIVEGVKGLTEAGIEFERQVVSIAAVLQTTSDIVGPGGRKLSQSEQIAAQEDRARNIQNVARQRLSPLGISGGAEATLVAAISEGLGSKGINASAETVASGAAAFGSVAQIAAPSLLSDLGRLRRDTSDITLGLPQAARTTLGAPIRRFLSRIGNAETEDDFNSAIKGLRPYEDALTNSRNISPSLSRIEGSIGNIQSGAGQVVAASLAPAIKVVADALVDLNKSITPLFEPLKELGSVFGDLVASAIRPAIFGVTGLIKFTIEKLGELPIVGKFFQKSSDPKAEAVANRESQITTLLSRSGIDETEFQNASGKVKSTPRNTANLFDQIRKLAAEDEEDPTRILNTLGLGGGIYDAETKDAQGRVKVGGLAGKQAGLALSGRGRAKQRDFLADSLEDIDLRLAGNDLNTGQRNKLTQGRESVVNQLSDQLVESINDTADKVALSLEKLNLVFGTSTSRQNLTNIGKAAGEISKDIASAQREINQGIKQGLDPNTIKAATSRLNELRLSLVQLLDAVKSNIDRSFNSKFIGESFTGRQAGIISDQAKDFAAAISNGASTQQARTLAADKASRRFVDNEQETAGGVLSLTQGLEQFSDFMSRIPERLKEFADNVTGAARTLKNFQDDQENRKLGREGQVLSAIESAKAAGASDAEIASMSGSQFAIGGNADDIKKRLALSNLGIAQRALDQGDDIDSEQQRGLERGLTGAQRDQKNFPREIRDREIGQDQLILDSYQKFAGTPLGEQLKPQAVAALSRIQGFNKSNGAISKFGQQDPGDLIDSIQKGSDLQKDNIPQFLAEIDKSISYIEKFGDALRQVTDTINQGIFSPAGGIPTAPTVGKTSLPKGAVPENPGNMIGSAILAALPSSADPKNRLKEVGKPGVMTKSGKIIGSAIIDALGSSNDDLLPEGDVFENALFGGKPNDVKYQRPGLDAQKSVRVAAAKFTAFGERIKDEPGKPQQGQDQFSGLLSGINDIKNIITNTLGNIVAEGFKRGMEN